MTGDEMVEWYHRLNEFEHTPGDSEGQGNLACPCGRKELDTTYSHALRLLISKYCWCPFKIYPASDHVLPPPLLTP